MTREKEDGCLVLDRFRTPFIDPVGSPGRLHIMTNWLSLQGTQNLIVIMLIVFLTGLTFEMTNFWCGEKEIPYSVDTAEKEKYKG
jgi:hypothetical protein